MTTPATWAVSKIEYDNAAGVLTDITALCLKIGDVKLGNVLQRTDPLGTSMPVFNPTGRGSFDKIPLSFMYRTGVGSVDELFGRRIPEDVDAATRTLRVTWSTGRYTEVETHLEAFDRSLNRDSGITMTDVVLQPTGVLTEV